MISSLHCPHCHHQFKNACIEDGAVKCPSCKAVIFQYRFPGEETLTPKEFMKLLDTRGVALTKDVKHWFHGPARRLAAGAFIVYVWAFLATTFQSEQKDVNTE